MSSIVHGLLKSKFTILDRLIPQYENATLSQIAPQEVQTVDLLVVALFCHRYQLYLKYQPHDQMLQPVPLHAVPTRQVL